MEQILALEINPSLVGPEIAAAGERRRPSRIFDEQVIELRLERGVLLRLQECGLQLFERRHQYLGHIGAAIIAEAAAHQHSDASPRLGGRSASKKAWSLPASFRPGAISTQIGRASGRERVCQYV